MSTARDGVSSTAERAREAYNAAADTYDDPALAFWDAFGRRAVERLHLAQGAHVLDVCAGTGASAIVAAHRVGPAGSVLAVDLSERMLEHAEHKAAQQQIAHLRTRPADMTSLGDAGASFDAVLCAFGLCYVDDMAGQLRTLRSLLRPGGVLAITAWAAGSFEPLASAFWEAVGRRKPELRGAFSPWDRIGDAHVLRSIFEQAGIPDAEIELESTDHPVAAAEEFWTIARGSGLRWTIERMMTEDQDAVRADVADQLAGARSMRFNVLYAVARTPPASSSGVEHAPARR